MAEVARTLVQTAQCTAGFHTLHMLDSTQHPEGLSDLAEVHCTKLWAQRCLLSQGNDADGSLSQIPLLWLVLSCLLAGSLWHSSCLECPHSSSACISCLESCYTCLAQQAGHLALVSALCLASNAVEQIADSFGLSCLTHVIIAWKQNFNSTPSPVPMSDLFKQCQVIITYGHCILVGNCMPREPCVDHLPCGTCLVLVDANSKDVKLSRMSCVVLVWNTSDQIVLGLMYRSAGSEACCTADHQQDDLCMYCC